MIGTLRRHSAWLWFFIIAAMIIGLVTVFRPSGRFSARGSGNFGSIDGVRISQDDYLDALREAQFQYFIARGDWPDRNPQRSGFDEQRETYNRLFFIQKLKEHNIEVDSAAVARTANEILLGFGRGRPFPFDEFVQRVLMPHSLGANDFERYIRHELGIQQLVTVLTLGGRLVTSQEAQSLYVREHQEFATEAVFFSGSNYLASVPPVSADVVAQFYTNQMAAYRVPDRVQVSYVKFDATNFVAEADQEMARMTNLNALVEENYQQRGTNYYQGKKTPEEVREKIRAEIREELAMRAARKKANDFASELFDREPMRRENLAALAKTNGLTLKVSAPFDEETGPQDFDAGPNFAKAAFSLTTNEPFAGPLVGRDSVCVISLYDKMPEEIPALEKIRDRVAADCRYSQAVQLARRAGAEFARALTNGLAQGKTFSASCAGSNVKPVSVPPFSLSTRALPEVEEQISLGQFKQLAFSTPPGKASGFSPSRNGGVVVFVQRHLPMDEAKMRADMPAFLNSIRRAWQSEALNLWYRKEAGKSMRDTPLARPEPSSPTASQGQTE